MEEGGRFCVGAGSALRAVKPSAPQLAATDRALKGHVQGSLRQVVAAYVSKNYANFSFKAETQSTMPQGIPAAGNSATSTCVRDAALATKLRIMIWAKADGRWSLCGHSQADQKIMNNTMWLTLKGRRYERLVPKRPLAQATEQQWMDQRLPCPSEFTGGGEPSSARSQTTANANPKKAEAEDFLGPSPRTSKNTSGKACSFSGASAPSP
eukprot:9174835-Pyramimonas_sp.AAC.1